MSGLRLGTVVETEDSRNHRREMLRDRQMSHAMTKSLGTELSHVEACLERLTEIANSSRKSDRPLRSAFCYDLEVVLPCEISDGR
jgi:hypothetical protein